MLVENSLRTTQRRLAQQQIAARVLPPGTPTWAKAGTAIAPAPNAGAIAENIVERAAEREEAIA